MRLRRTGERTRGALGGRWTAAGAEPPANGASSVNGPSWCAGWRAIGLATLGMLDNQVRLAPCPRMPGWRRSGRGPVPGVVRGYAFNWPLRKVCTNHLEVSYARA